MLCTYPAIAIPNAATEVIELTIVVAMMKEDGGLLSSDELSGEVAGGEMLFVSDSIVSCRLITFCSTQVDTHGQSWYWSDRI